MRTFISHWYWTLGLALVALALVAGVIRESGRAGAVATDDPYPPSAAHLSVESPLLPGHSA